MPSEASSSRELPRARCSAKRPARRLANRTRPDSRESVTYADAHGHLHTVATAGPDGIYLIVTRAPRLGVEAGEFQPLGGAGGGEIRAVSYRNGHVCHLAPREPFSQYSEGACPNVGQRSSPAPRLSAAQLATPIFVVARTQLVRMRYRDVRLPMLDISFRAPLAVTKASAEYRVLVNYPGHAGNCGVVSVAPVFADVRRGQLVHQQVDDEGCRGVFHVRVQYVYGAHSDGLPAGLDGPSVTIGTKNVDVR